MRTMSDDGLLGVWVWCVEGWPQEIHEIIGPFDYAEIVRLFDHVCEDEPVTKLPERVDIENPPAERFCFVDWVESETQYGQGYGDVLTIPGYYSLRETDVVR